MVVQNLVGFEFVFIGFIRCFYRVVDVHRSVVEHIAINSSSRARILSLFLFIIFCYSPSTVQSFLNQVPLRAPSLTNSGKAVLPGPKETQYISPKRVSLQFLGCTELAINKYYSITLVAFLGSALS